MHFDFGSPGDGSLRDRNPYKSELLPVLHGGPCVKPSAGMCQSSLDIDKVPYEAVERGYCFLAWGENCQRISDFQWPAEEILIGGTNGLGGCLVWSRNGPKRT